MPVRLFEPITLRDTEIRNRIWIAPMCQYAADQQDGVPTDWHLVHLGGLARGGAGAVIVEATAVTPEGRISTKDLGLWNDTQRDALARIVDFIHSQGATAGIQLAHAGRKSSVWPAWGAAQTGSLPHADGGWETLAPSAIPYPGLSTPRAMTQSDLDAVVEAFVAAARRAVEAGFDLVEIHAAHGYLLHEFLSPLSNTRTDGYGGSPENRARLLLEVVDAVRAAIGETMPLLVRLSATDWTAGGLTIDDTVRTTERLRDRGVDLIDVSSSGNVPATIPVGPGYQTGFAAEIRYRTGMLTGAVGIITDPAQAEHIVATGQADVTLIAREALRDPNFPIRAARELGHDHPPVPAAYGRAYR